VKERPILFNSEMVRAVLSGQKTQTRRLVKPQPHSEIQDITHNNSKSCWFWWQNGLVGDSFSCPFGDPGDRLWVRETWAWSGDRTVAESDRVERGEVWYCADPKRTHGGIGWRPSIHMPRWASRITLEITEVRVQRLRDISEEDAKAEGVKPYDCPVSRSLMKAVGADRGERALKPCPYTSGFAKLWDEITQPGDRWADNPWVWAINFKRKGGAK
jgi:hypothetical protein